ncbi:hypothetical protein E5676_scaffold173G00070 [Cucumis melo var. makuwa]|uniref:Uncharacterized protein n=1 Tax=Cucumis melo var. makuwa TaxID=1194695 RepID=A0A5D3DFL1_CUCMM|nr:hypothetical protein E5676_scaffold173G00070 [Cucumis melo var. makuwa]
MKKRSKSQPDVRKYSQLFKPFLKYFVRRKRPKEVTKLRPIKEKLFPEQNHDVLENYCSKIQAPSQANRSDSHSSHLQHLEYYSFSMYNSEVKFLRGVSSHSPVIPSKKKSEITFDPPFNVSSEECEHFEKTDRNEEQLQMEPSETDLNAHFQIDEELEDVSNVDDHCSACPLSVQPIRLLDHLKPFVADCSLFDSMRFHLKTN